MIWALSRILLVGWLVYSSRWGWLAPVLAWVAADCYLSFTPSGRRWVNARKERRERLKRFDAFLDELQKQSARRKRFTEGPRGSRVSVGSDIPGGGAA